MRLSLRPAPLGIVLAALLACTPEAAPPRPPLVDLGSADSGARPSIAEADASASTEAPKVPADAGTSPYPPTGSYAITTRVISDDCRPKYTPPAPWDAIVQAGAERGVAKVNLLLSAIPPSNATSSSARSDLSVEPRRPTKRTSTPLPACASYTTAQTLEIVESGPAGFTVAISVEYGDASKCGGALPSKCTTKVEHVYKLVRSLCPAECTRGLVFRRPDAGAAMSGAGDAEADCRCP